MFDNPEVLKAFPKDVVERSLKITGEIGGGTGAYSHSKGVLSFRNSIADFIKARDGHACDPENVYLIGGASAGIEKVLTAIISGPKDAVLIPIPQYPLYSALITILGGQQVGYYLEEEKGWSFNIVTTREVIKKARRDGLNPKAFCVINPGNPTGQLMSQQDLTDIVKLCREENLVLLSDEVYQENVYTETKKFVAMRRLCVISAPSTTTSSWPPSIPPRRGSSGSAGGAGASWSWWVSRPTWRRRSSSTAAWACAPT